MDKELKEKFEELIRIMNKEKKDKFEKEKVEIKKQISERLDNAECYIFVTDTDFMGAGSTADILSLIFSALENIIEKNKLPNEIIRPIFEKLYKDNKNTNKYDDGMLEFLEELLK